MASHHKKRRKRRTAAPPKPAEINLLELDEFADALEGNEDSDGLRPHGSSRAFFSARDLDVRVDAQPTSRLPFIDDF